MGKQDSLWLNLMQYGKALGCHQLQERSFYVLGYQFFVCARCTGVIIGEIFAVLLLLIGIRINIYSCVLLLLIMGADWLIQYLDILKSTNIRRLITGLLAGVGLTYIYFYTAMLIFNIVRNLTSLF
ncbi:MAG: DUF2085 domain-containing protein [Eubacteriales bacterium]|nr:DUF2085 domain-containing protein [Eubacteriales bacterium]